MVGVSTLSDKCLSFNYRTASRSTVPFRERWDVSPVYYSSEIEARILRTKAFFGAVKQVSRLIAYCHRNKKPSVAIDRFALTAYARSELTLISNYLIESLSEGTSAKAASGRT